MRLIAPRSSHDTGTSSRLHTGGIPTDNTLGCWGLNTNGPTSRSHRRNEKRRCATALLVTVAAHASVAIVAVHCGALMRLNTEAARFASNRPKPTKMQRLLPRQKVRCRPHAKGRQLSFRGCLPHSHCTWRERPTSLSTLCMGIEFLHPGMEGVLYLALVSSGLCGLSLLILVIADKWHRAAPSGRTPKRCRIPKSQASGSSGRS